MYLQPINKDSNLDKFYSAPVLHQNNSVKCISKNNPSYKEDSKQMSLETYTIDEVSITICPRSISETLDKMNMITADIKQNGIDQIELE